MKVIELTEDEYYLLILCLGAATAMTFRDNMREMGESIQKLYYEKVKNAVSKTGE